MKTIEIDSASAHLADLIGSLQKDGPIVLCDHGEPRAWIILPKPADPKLRDLTPDPQLMPVRAANFDASEPLSAEEWPDHLR